MQVRSSNVTFTSRISGFHVDRAEAAYISSQVNQVFSDTQPYLQGSCLPFPLLYQRCSCPTFILVSFTPFPFFLRTRR